MTTSLLTCLTGKRLVSGYSFSQRKFFAITQPPSTLKQCHVVRIKNRAIWKTYYNKESMELTTVDIHPCIMPQNRLEFQKRPRVCEMMDSYPDNVLMFCHTPCQDLKENALAECLVTLVLSGLSLLTL